MEFVRFERFDDIRFAFMTCASFRAVCGLGLGEFAREKRRNTVELAELYLTSRVASTGSTVLSAYCSVCSRRM